MIIINNKQVTNNQIWVLRTGRLSLYKCIAVVKNVYLLPVGKGIDGCFWYCGGNDQGYPESR